MNNVVDKSIPSDDINSFEAFLKIPAREKGYTMVPFPIAHPATGEIFEVGMVVLTAEEVAVARSNSTKFARAHFKPDLPAVNSSGYEMYLEVLQQYQSAEILAFAVRNPTDPTKKFFNKAADVLKLDTNAVGILVNHYNDVNEGMPHLISEGKLDDEVMKEYVQKLVRNDTGVSFLVNAFSLGSQKLLLKFMADQLAILSPAKYSTTMSVDSSTETTLDQTE